MCATTRSTRHGFGKPPHPGLRDIIAAGDDSYGTTLRSFLAFVPDFERIEVDRDDSSPEPHWLNGYLPGLDAAALYGFLCQRNPSTYLEIGSGNSTKFARRAIRDHGLRTWIVSIDPTPRAEVDGLCDSVLRGGLESVDLGLFDTLSDGDIVFFDGSHRTFTNSDATVFFLDVLPRLPPGVLVQIHDVFLPDDYLITFARVAFSEQYLLAVLLLAAGNDIRIVLPNWHAGQIDNLRGVIAELWDSPLLKRVETHGASFWFERSG